MMVSKKLIIGVLSLLLFSTQAYGKDYYRYFGFGTSTGTYDEKRFDLYEDVDSIEIAKKLYLESIDANPYLKAGEAELAGLYYNLKEYDMHFY